MNKQKFIFPITLFLFFVPVLFACAGTVSNTYKYAWSNNVGYINFNNTIVENDFLTGYAWSENTGWINMNPTQGGVINDGEGNLSGSAWGEGLGWIDFSNVKISPTTGKFSGTATGDEVGILTFDCTQCDVRTNWIPDSPSSGSKKTSSETSFIPERIVSEGLTQIPIIPKHIDAQNEPLIILPYQSGTLTQDTEVGEVTLNVPDFNIAEQTIFTIVLETIKKSDSDFTHLKMDVIHDAFFDVTAKDQNGNPIHFFPKPITLTLPIPKDLINSQNLAVYWLDEVEEKWILIPEAIFSSDSVTFQVDHLTKFAIFSKTTNGFPNQISATMTAKPTLEGFDMEDMNYKNLGQIFLFFLIMMLLFFVIKNKKYKK